MFGKLFGRKQAAPALKAPRLDLGPIWGEPLTPFADYFNIHFHALGLAATIRALETNYMPLAVTGPSIVAAEQGDWTTAYFAPELMARVGFNKLASQIAAEHDAWVIGYRVYADVGLDVHYFQGEEHVAGLTMADDEVEIEPATPAIFAELGNVSAIIPRAPEVHPLDCHFALLAALGVHDAALTWPDAQARCVNGTLGLAERLDAV